MEGCLKMSDGFIRCPDETILFKNKKRVALYRLNNVSECHTIGFPQCDPSPCYISFATCVDGECFTSHVICTSSCSDEACERAFQCSDNRLIFLSQFCDGTKDCRDDSDEQTNQPGFKCHKCISEVESSRTSLASRTSSRTHFEVLGLGLGLEGQVLGLGLGLEASSPRKLPCPRLEDSTIL